MQKSGRSPSSILIVRLSAIGDVVMASGLPAAIKKKYPDAKITWLCQPECWELLNNHPQIDSVIIWPRAEWQQLWKNRKYLQLNQKIGQFRNQLRSENFDLALDLQGLLKSGYLVWLSGAKKRIGLGSSEGSQLMMSEVISRDLGDPELIGSEYRYLAEHLGCPVDGFLMQLAVSESTAASVEVKLSELRLDQYIVICPFTTRPQKHWFEDYWRQTSDLLKQEYHLPVVMLGGPGDIETAADLSSETSIINLVGKTSLQEAAEIIRRSKGLIGVDTGLTHMGHVMQVPTLALFGSTRPYLKTGMTSSKVIYLDLHCAPCRRNPTCEGSFDCLRQITPEIVIKEFNQLRPLPL